MDRVSLRFGSGDGREEPMGGTRRVGGGGGRGGDVVGGLLGWSSDRSRDRDRSGYRGGGEESTVMGDLTTTMAVIRTVRVMEGIWMKKWVGVGGDFIEN